LFPFLAQLTTFSKVAPKENNSELITWTFYKPDALLLPNQHIKALAVIYSSAISHCSLLQKNFFIYGHFNSVNETKVL